MTGAEIITAARTDYLDDAVTPYLWSNTLLERYLNLAEKEACRRASLLPDKTTAKSLDIKAANAATQINVNATAKTFTRLTGSWITDGFEPGDEFNPANFASNSTAKIIESVTALVITVTSDTGLVDETGDGDETLTSYYHLCSMDIIAGTSLYKISKKVLRTVRCIPSAGGRNIEKKTEAWLDKFYSDWRTATGDPVYYLEEKGSIRFVPQPTSNDTVSFSLFRLPLQDMTIASGRSPEIPEEYHEELIDYMCYLAYRKQDSETEDRGRSADHEANFTKNFGVKVSAITEENRRRKPRNRSIWAQEFGFS